MRIIREDDCLLFTKHLILLRCNQWQNLRRNGPRMTNNRYCLSTGLCRRHFHYSIDSFLVSAKLWTILWLLEAPVTVLYEHSQVCWRWATRRFVLLLIEARTFWAWFEAWLGHYADAKWTSACWTICSPTFRSWNQTGISYELDLDGSSALEQPA